MPIIPYEKMNIASKVLYDDVEALQKLFYSITSHIDEIAKDWEGEAREAFVRSFETKKVIMNDLVCDIRKYADFLKEYSETMKESDSPIHDKNESMESRYNMRERITDEFLKNNAYQARQDRETLQAAFDKIADHFKWVEKWEGAAQDAFTQSIRDFRQNLNNFASTLGTFAEFLERFASVMCDIDENIRWR